MLLAYAQICSAITGPLPSLIHKSMKSGESCTISTKGSRSAFFIPLIKSIAVNIYSKTSQDSSFIGSLASETSQVGYYFGNHEGYLSIQSTDEVSFDIFHAIIPEECKETFVDSTSPLNFSANSSICLWITNAASISTSFSLTAPKNYALFYEGANASFTWTGIGSFVNRMKHPSFLVAHMLGENEYIKIMSEKNAEIQQQKPLRFSFQSRSSHTFLVGTELPSQSPTPSPPPSRTHYIEISQTQLPKSASSSTSLIAIIGLIGVGSIAIATSIAIRKRLIFRNQTDESEVPLCIYENGEGESIPPATGSQKNFFPSLR